jgi:hypothetical protein
MNSPYYYQTINELRPATRSMNSLSDATGRSEGAAIQRLLQFKVKPLIHRAGKQLFRGLFAAWLLTLLLSCILFVQSNASDHTVAAKSDVEAVSNEKLLVIAPGDTLWEIASYYKPDGMDLRQFVYELQVRNKLDGATLQAGEIIMVPLQKGSLNG